MKIYRAIAINEGDEINLDSVGCSWSLCQVFAEDHVIGNIMAATGINGYVILEAEIDEDDERIDWENTLFAMENRPNEFEVVIYGDIEFEVIDSEGHEEKEGNVFAGSTGNNEFEDYTDRYDGEISKEDFLKVAREF